MVEFTSDSYEKTMYEKILAHSNCAIEMDMNYPDEQYVNAIESVIVIANYGEGENVAIECSKCNEVIIDFDRPEETETPQRRITEDE